MAQLFDSRCVSWLSRVAAATSGLVLAASAPWATGPASAQVARPATVTVAEAVILTNGWAFLSQGDLTKADEKARQIRTINPRSPAAFALSLEVAIARDGAAGGLQEYENWVGTRLEEPSFIRRVAWASLEETAAQSQDPRARLDALMALVDHGDEKARRTMTDSVAAGNVAEARLMAARGDDLAVRQLATAIGGQLPNLVGAIEALGESGSAQAVGPLLKRLEDPRPEVRGAAAEALARTGGQAVVGPLRNRLGDPSAHVRIKAASALYRLGDTSGLRTLTDLAASDAAATRLVAAEALASHPDAAWEALVRGLTMASEPDVRLAAAHLAARFDRELAAATFQRLTSDANQAMRDEATRLMVRESPRSLTDLRGALRDADPLVRVAAASAVLDLAP